VVENVVMLFGGRCDQSFDLDYHYWGVEEAGTVSFF
jgi:hypothetical protein